LWAQALEAEGAADPNSYKVLVHRIRTASMDLETPTSKAKAIQAITALNSGIDGVFNTPDDIRDIYLT